MSYILFTAVSIYILGYIFLHALLGRYAQLQEDPWRLYLVLLVWPYLVYVAVKEMNDEL